MLTLLTFSILLFLLVTAFYLNITKKPIKYKNKLHRPLKILLTFIYSINLAGFIIAGYLILSYEIQITVDQWTTDFFIITGVLMLTSPVIYFSKQIAQYFRWSITYIRIILITTNVYPLIKIFYFYNH